MTGRAPRAAAASRRAFFTVLVMAFAGVGAVPVVAETPERVTGEKGSYVMLLGADGPLAAWYWIGPETIVVFPSAEGALVLPGANQNRMVDRGLLPQRIVASYSSESRVLDYDRLPVFADDGTEALPIEVHTYALALTPEAILVPERRDDLTYTLSFRWLAEESQDLPSGPVVVQRYESGVLEDGEATMHERVYLPAFGVDFDARTWSKAVDLRSGTGLAASTDITFLTWSATDLEPEVAACLTTLRGSAEYAAYAEEFAGLEWRSTILLPQGYSDMAALGRGDYRELGRRTGVPERFTDCFRRNR